MTPEKKHALWNEALRYALVEDDWLGRPSGEIPLSHRDPEYTPMVPGISFRVVDGDEFRKLFEQHGQLTYVSIWSPRSSQELSSVHVSVGRIVSVSAARRSEKENGCRQNINLNCERTWGDWECHADGKRGSECDELAFDDRRWQTLEGLTMTREDQHAMWNSMLGYAEDSLDSPYGTITINSDSLDPTYVPAVEGMSFRILSGAEIAELADSHCPAGYVRLSDSYVWYRGPVTVLMSMDVYTGKELETEPIAGTSWHSRFVNRPRSVDFKCRRSSVGWSCEPQ
jgi:hypothetical protein